MSVYPDDKPAFSDDEEPKKNTNGKDVKTQGQVAKPVTNSTGRFSKQNDNNARVIIQRLSTQTGDIEGNW